MVSLMILLIALTGTTYAWFKINSSATVSGFNFTVTGGEGFQISLNGDEDSYSNQLTPAQMRQAILCGYNNAYNVRKGKLYYGKTSTEEISDAAAKELIKKSILLAPATPYTEEDGTFTFKNQFGSTIAASSGKYIEFSLYIKANGGLKDDNTYDLYLLGSSVENVVDMNNNVVSIDKCSIRSLNNTKVKLKREMTTSGKEDARTGTRPNDGPEYVKGKYIAGDEITVYTSNALRFSIGDDNETLGANYETIEKHTNKIFEISDDYAHDLGSYATNYDKAADTSDLSDEEKLELDNLYNANKNAMFTYYNNIRPYSKLTPLDYSEIKNKEIIRHLWTEDEIKQGKTPYKFVSVRSGREAKRVTFRFWLEGWDADCFDGLPGTIEYQKDDQGNYVFDDKNRKIPVGVEGGQKTVIVNLSFGSYKNGQKTIR